MNQQHDSLHFSSLLTQLDSSTSQKLIFHACLNIFNLSPRLAWDLNWFEILFVCLFSLLTRTRRLLNIEGRCDDEFRLEIAFELSPDEILYQVKILETILWWKIDDLKNPRDWNDHKWCCMIQKTFFNFSLYVDQRYEILTCSKSFPLNEEIKCQNWFEFRIKVHVIVRRQQSQLQVSQSDKKTKKNPFSYAFHQLVFVLTWFSLVQLVAPCHVCCWQCWTMINIFYPFSFGITQQSLEQANWGATWERRKNSKKTVEGFFLFFLVFINSLLKKETSSPSFRKFLIEFMGRWSLKFCITKIGKSFKCEIGSLWEIFIDQVKFWVWSSSSIWVQDN